jgi:hypothetical protein
VRGVAYWHLRWRSYQNSGLNGSSGFVGQKFLRRVQDKTGRWQVVSIFDSMNRATGNLDPKAIVIDGFGYNPCLVTGELRSIMSGALKPLMRIRDFFLDSATVAESTNSNPPMVTRYKYRQGEWTGAGVLDGTGEAQARRQNNGFLRDNAEVAALHSQMRSVAKTVNPAALGAYGISKADLGGTVESRVIDRLTGDDGCPKSWSSEFQIQSDRVLEAAQLPNPRGDLLGLLTFANTETAEIFGLSDNAFTANAPSAADANTAKETKDITITTLQSKVARVLMVAYDATFLPNDVNVIMNEVRVVVRERRRQRRIEPDGYNNNGGDNPKLAPPSNSNSRADNKFHRHPRNGVDYSSDEDDVEATRRTEPTPADRDANATGNNMAQYTVEEPNDDFDESVYNTIRGTRLSIRIEFRDEIIAEKVELDEMYNTGMMSWTTYVHAVAQLKRVNGAKLVKKDPLSKEDRLAASLPGYLAVLQFREQTKLAQQQFKEQSKVNQQQLKQTKELAVLSSETTLAKPTAGAGGGGAAKKPAAKSKPKKKSSGKKKAAVVINEVDDDEEESEHTDEEESADESSEGDLLIVGDDYDYKGPTIRDADDNDDTAPQAVSSGRVSSARKRKAIESDSDDDDDDKDGTDRDMSKIADIVLELARGRHKRRNK